MSGRDFSKDGGPVFSLIQSEDAQQWQCTYIPAPMKPETRTGGQWKTAFQQRRLSLRQLSETMVQEYNWIKDLGDAENGIFNFSPELSYGQVLLKDVVSYYRFSKIGMSKHFVLQCTSEPMFLMTDVILFRRLIGEVLKNALEASADRQTVTVSCWPSDDELEITVHNERCIPEMFQGNIFRHSSSTKGAGRGFGTYCVKLFAEKYLRGTVSFRSAISEGTTFILRFPRVNLGRPLSATLVSTNLVDLSRK